MDTFLRDYWQKRPCVIRQFFADFEDPIDEHELAGFAQQDDIDSRLISFAKGQWQVTQGPIADFEPLCKGAWTLLVQGLDRHLEEIDALGACVKQMGNWRMDDVLVSFSSPGGSVGAHIDEYDVFIVQGKGARRWQVGEPGQYDTLIPHPLLKQIREFTPVIDEVLQSGDAVYIPPKHPHNGVALSECFNYSIGFRAPTNLEILHGIVDAGSELESAQQRYTDPELANYRGEGTPSACVSPDELKKLKASLLALLDTAEAEKALLQSISQQSLPNMCPEQPFDIDEVIELLENGTQLTLAPGVKPIYAQAQSQDFTFYIDGQAYVVEGLIADFVKHLMGEPQKALGSSLTTEQIPLCAHIVMQLLNEGFIDIL